MGKPNQARSGHIPNFMTDPTEASSEEIPPIPFLGSPTFSSMRSLVERHLYPHEQTLVRERPHRARRPSRPPLLRSPQSPAQLFASS